MQIGAIHLSTKESADELGRGPDRLRQLERAGQIRAIRTRGGVRIFLLSDVLEFKAKRAAQREEAAHGR